MSTRTPVYATCPDCRRRVLEVRHDHHQGILIGEPRLDPVSLDEQQIVACVITGARIWQLHDQAGEPVTSRRTRWWPLNPIPGHVVPEHVCSRVWDAPRLNLAPDPSATPDTCPF